MNETGRTLSIKDDDGVFTIVVTVMNDLGNPAVEKSQRRIVNVVAGPFNSKDEAEAEFLQIQPTYAH